MAERVFAGKLQRAGFADVWVGGHQPFGIDQAALYPLFTPEVIQVMRETIPADRQDHVATGVIVFRCRKRAASVRSRASRSVSSAAIHGTRVRASSHRSGSGSGMLRRRRVSQPRKRQRHMSIGTCPAGNCASAAPKHGHRRRWSVSWPA